MSQRRASWASAARPADRYLAQPKGRPTQDLLALAREELQSVNEELESSKEELQSLNEELNSVNQQPQSKIGELESVHGDLQNLLASSEIATVCLDRDFRIRWFSPAARGLFDLLPTDVGRPVGAFAPMLSNASVLGMLDAGAAGYVTKNTAGETLLQAIRTVAAGLFRPSVLGPDARSCRGKELEMRKQGFFAAAMLPMDEFEYTGIVDMLGKLQPRFRVRKEKRADA